jgi:hypothetical protein
MASQNSTPCDDAEAEIFRNRNAGNDVVLRIFDNQNGNVNTSREPGILQSVRRKCGSALEVDM